MNEIEQAFFNDGYAIAQKHLITDPNSNSVIKIQGEIYSLINEFLSLFMSKCIQEGKSVACKKGCSWCCQQTVMILPYEALYIERFLQERFDGKTIEKIKQKVSVRDNQTSKMKLRDYLHYKMACPFLEDNKCSIYEVRPMACRIYLSSEVKSCITEFNNPKDFEIFPSLFELPLRVGKSLNAGITKAYNERNIYPVEHRFESLIMQLFDKKVTSQEWVRGSENFVREHLTDEEIRYLNRF